MLPDVLSDGVFGLDFSLPKTFKERFNLQLRAKAFTLTNTPTFDTPGRSLGSATFGVVTATSSTPVPRQLQLALQLRF